MAAARAPSTAATAASSSTCCMTARVITSSGTRHRRPTLPATRAGRNRLARLLCRGALCRRRLRPPRLSRRPQVNVYSIALMAMENNASLGFAYILGSRLYTWSRKVDTDEESTEWVQCKVIELEKAIPVANPDDKPFVVGFAEGVGVVFISSGVGLFTIKLNSGQVKKVDEPGEYFSVLPYMSFYLPETGYGGGHDATDIPHSAKRIVPLDML